MRTNCIFLFIHYEASKSAVTTTLSAIWCWWSLALLSRNLHGLLYPCFLLHLLKYGAIIVLIDTSNSGSSWVLVRRTRTSNGASTRPIRYASESFRVQVVCCAIISCVTMRSWHSDTAVEKRAVVFIHCSFGPRHLTRSVSKHLVAT